MSDEKSKLVKDIEAVESAMADVAKAESSFAAPASSLDGLRYALQMVQGRRILNRPPAYLAAVDEMEIFLLAAIERVEKGEPMYSVANVSNFQTKPKL